MASSREELVVVVEGGGGGGGGEETEVVGDEPVSPTGQYFNSSVLSVSIIAAFDSEIPIDDSPTMAVLENVLLPLNPRFSSIMVTDKHGTQQWKRVKVKLEEHVNVPIFPPDLSVESYDEHMQDYVSKIATVKLPQDRPLWEIHIIKYPTRQAAGTLLFKLHHALGDGFSLMGALFSCLKRADDPSLPLTFPTSRPNPARDLKGAGILKSIPRALSALSNTARDFASSLLKSNLAQDDVSPIRSKDFGVEFRPISVSSIIFSLEDIRQIKAKLGGTINDVITGMVFYGTRLYMQAAGKGGAGGGEVTALVLLNTRTISDYQPPTEMTKPDAESPWGNQFGFLHVAVPQCRDAENANPLDFVSEAREIIKRKRNSLAVHLTGRLLEIMRSFRGPEATAQYIHSTLRNTSMTVSNLIGPMEQMQIAGHPVRSFYFMVVGVPQSLTITMVSYMGMLKVAVGAEKGFINSQLLISCMEKAFARIYEETVGRTSTVNGSVGARPNTSLNIA